jgi:hypothetical protein
LDTGKSNLVFDFAPSKKYEPALAVMISHQKLYSPDLDDSLVPHAYKLPSQKESMEVAKAVMQQGDVFAFFQSQDKGSLAVWIPASGDGTVKGWEYLLFS